jgi:hypothetical protein
MASKLLATISLFVALGGSAYAAVTITGRNVKDGSLTSADVRDRSLLSKDFKQGQLPAGPQGATGAIGPQGPAGRQATTAFAYVRDDFPSATQTAEIGYGQGVTDVSDPSGNNPYSLTFDRSLAGCVVQGMPGAGNPTDTNFFALHATVGVDLDPVHADQVIIRFRDGAEVDTSFMVEAFC